MISKASVLLGMLEDVDFASHRRESRRYGKKTRGQDYQKYRSNHRRHLNRQLGAVHRGGKKRGKS